MLWWYRWKLTWNSPDSRSDAAFRLGLNGYPQAIDPLRRALSDPAGEVRASAAMALGRLHAVQAVEPLCALLRDPEREVRKAAAEALRAIGGDRAIGPLCEAMGDSDTFVRKAVVEALKNSRDPRAIDAMTRAAKDPEPYVAEVAVEALGRIGDPNTVGILLEVYALAYGRDDKYRGTGLEFDKKVLGVLEQFASRSVPGLIANLQHSHPEVRRFAAQLLGKFGNPQATPALAATLRDPFGLVRHEASAALSLLEGEPAGKERTPDARSTPASEEIDAMIRALANLQDSGHWRGEAARFLGRARDARGFLPLLEALQDKEDDVRAGAAEALEWFGDPRAGPALIRALGMDEDGSALTRIVHALGTLKIPQAVDALIEALDRLSQKGVLPHETTYTAQEVQRTVLRALGRMGDSCAIPSLVSKLSSPDAKDRKVAAEALETLGFQPPNDRDRAQLAVLKEQWNEAARLGGEAIEALQAAARDPSTATAAVRALGATRDPGALTPLVEALQDPSLSSEAATSLRGVLEACGSKLAGEDLERLASTGDATQIRTAVGNCYYAEQISSNVDCSAIRQLARQELLRREGRT